VLDCPGFFTDFGEWTGVPLAMLLEEAGVKPEATEVTFFAIDGYNQTQTLEHIDKYGVFLAYIVNGVILPPEHGYPLRVVDKGSAGSAWVKWVDRIIVE
jgi:sulfoxide reductase catalytic subunit YedY